MQVASAVPATPFRFSDAGPRWPAAEAAWRPSMLVMTLALASAAAAEGTLSLPASLSPALELLPAAPLDRQLSCNASLQTWGGNHRQSISYKNRA